MKNYNYGAIVDELIQKGIIQANSVFDYRQHPLAHSYEQMFQFAQVNLSEVCLRDNYNIEPSRFYYPNQLDVNACASCDGDYFIIEVNRGVYEKLFNLFCRNNTILDDPQLRNYQRFDELVEKKPHEVSLCYLMYQTATMFTYYHELGHLIQFSNQINSTANKVSPLSVGEKYVSGALSVPFNPIDHIMEYDADLHGANSTAFHLIEFWGKMGKEKTTQNLTTITVSSLVGIMGYIILLWDSFDEALYYDEYTHPHPLIRIYWILAVIVERIKGYNHAVDERFIMNETLRVLNIYLMRLGKGNVHDKFILPLHNNYQLIEDYSESVISQARLVPFLASNIVHKRPV